MPHIPTRPVPYLLVTFAILLCIGIYWDGLYGPLLLDDISTFGNILKADFGSKNILPNLLSDSGPLKRPVSMLSFIINGLYGNNLFYWKLTNLFIHLVNGIFIFLLAKKLTSLLGNKNSLIAAIIASAWVLHPLHVSTVLYTVQRMTELSTLFVFAAMLTYITARERQQKEASARVWHLQAITWLILFPLGVLSKENAVLFPAFILLLEVFFFNREKLSDRSLFNILSALSIIVISAFAIKSNWLLNGYIGRDFTLTERLLTEGRVMVKYLGMLLVPAQNQMGFAHDDILISRGLMEPWSTLPSLLTISALIFLSFILRKKYPLIGFGLLFFFLGHTLESTLIPLDIMYEHRNYLPSFGIFLAAVSTISIIIKNRTILTTFSIALFSLFIFITYARAQTWSATTTLYYYMEMTHPRSERLITIKATQLENIGEYSKARQILEKFSSLGAQLQRLNINCTENKHLKNQLLNITLDESKIVDNYATMQLTNLANRGMDKECIFSAEEFLSLLKKVATLPSIKKNNQQILSMYIAHYLWELNRQEQALESLKKTFAINRSNPTPLFLACEWMLDTNRLDEAKETCKAALNIANSSRLGKYEDLANQVRKRHNLPSAIKTQ